MNIELTEEEREFIERVCERALLFATLGLNTSGTIDNESDFEKITNLAAKLKNE